MIFTEEELSRISIQEPPDCVPHIIADVHGMKCHQAKRFINNIINVIKSAFRLDIIHGYNHGTAIKDMLAENLINNHISEKHQDSANQGVTHLVIA